MSTEQGTRRWAKFEDPDGREIQVEWSGTWKVWIDGVCHGDEKISAEDALCTCTAPNGPGGFHDNDCLWALRLEGITRETQDYVIHWINTIRDIADHETAWCSSRHRISAVRTGWHGGSCITVTLRGLGGTYGAYDFHFQNSWMGDDPSEHVQVFVSPTSEHGQIWESHVREIIERVGVKPCRFDALPHEICGYILEVLAAAVQHGEQWVWAGESDAR